LRSWGSSGSGYAGTPQFSRARGRNDAASRAIDEENVSAGGGADGGDSAQRGVGCYVHDIETTGGQGAPIEFA
jgi:hypothetical protein